MTKFSDFKDWYLNNGVIEDLKQFSKTEIIDGIMSLKDIKNSLLRQQKYEMAVIVRQTEKDLNSALGIYTSFDGAYMYNGTPFDDDYAIYKHIKRFENRQDSLDKLID